MIVFLLNYFTSSFDNFLPITFSFRGYLVKSDMRYGLSYSFLFRCWCLAGMILWQCLLECSLWASPWAQMQNRNLDCLSEVAFLSCHVNCLSCWRLPDERGNFWSFQFWGLVLLIILGRYHSCSWSSYSLPCFHSSGSGSVFFRRTLVYTQIYFEKKACWRFLMKCWPKEGWCHGQRCFQSIWNYHLFEGHPESRIVTKFVQ